MKLGVAFREILPEPVVLELDRAYARIRASWNIEHRENGQHAEINASGHVAERGRTVPMGEWVDVPFDSSLFTSQSGTWTVGVGDQQSYRYMRLGTTLFVSFSIQNTSMSGAPSTLWITLPDRLMAAATSGTMESVGWLDENGTYGTTRIYISGTEQRDKIQITKTDPTATFANATNTTQVRGQIMCEVVEG